MVFSFRQNHIYLVFGTFASSSRVQRVDGLELIEGVDLGYVPKGALADMHLIVVFLINKRDLLPVTLLAAGGTVYLVNIRGELCAVGLRPILYADHLMAVQAAHRFLFDDA